MDFNQFYVWRRQFAIVEMSSAPVKPTTCHRVYEALHTDGYTSKDAEGYHRLLPHVNVPQAKRQARMILNTLITDNQRLIRKLVSQLSKRSTAFLEEEDLFQAGLMALMRTLERFDPERFATKKVGASFASYLRHWVRHYMQASMADQQTIKHPKQFGMPYAVHKRSEDILHRTGERATPEQLGQHKVRGKEVPVTQKDLDMWAAAGNSIVSLDQMVTQHGNSESKYTGAGVDDYVSPGELPDSSKSPESLLTRAQLGQKAEQVANTLPPSERMLIEEIREGVPNASSAKRLGVTEEYARQLRRALIEKMRRMVGRVS